MRPRYMCASVCPDAEPLSDKGTIIRPRVWHAVERAESNGLKRKGVDIKTVAVVAATVWS